MNPGKRLLRKPGARLRGKHALVHAFRGGVWCDATAPSLPNPYRTHIAR